MPDEDSSQTVKVSETLACRLARWLVFFAQWSARFHDRFGRIAVVAVLFLLGVADDAGSGAEAS
jgi:hypothetical protein